jgi:hypothetical protein
MFLNRSARFRVVPTTRRTYSRTYHPPGCLCRPGGGWVTREDPSVLDLDSPARYPTSRHSHTPSDHVPLLIALDSCLRFRYLQRPNDLLATSSNSSATDGRYLMTRVNSKFDEPWLDETPFPTWDAEFG